MPINEQKTNASSDASREAPERAREDTSKEAKLRFQGSCPFVRLPVKFLRLSRDAPATAEAAASHRAGYMSVERTRVPSGTHSLPQSEPADKRRDRFVWLARPGSLSRNLPSGTVSYEGIAKI